MNQRKSLVGLNINSPLAIPEAQNFLPPSWPPPKDFPVVINAEGEVVSRYGDSIWNLTPWANRVASINFGDGPRRRNTAEINSQNSDLFRQVAAWWIYGPSNISSAIALVRRCEYFRPIFILCSQQGISATELPRYQRVAERIVEALAPSTASYVLTLLHDLWEQRDGLGFFLLNTDGLRHLAMSVSTHEKLQTPYIPPRIWSYQVNRLRACLDDFNAHRQKIEDCFNFCLKAYARNAGSLSKACTSSLPSWRAPFQVSAPHLTGKQTGSKYLGPFINTAVRFGLDGLLSRWVGNVEVKGPKAFSEYFNLIGKFGTAYILNFSMMRIDEGLSLRTDCLTIELDVVTGEEIYILQGPTTKTVKDGDARWIASPSVQVAVEAMSCVARLRMVAAEANSTAPTTKQDISNPLLVIRAYEPWRAKSEYLSLPLSTKLTRQSYSSQINRYSKLFDLNELCITKDDIQIARLINPTLNPELFDVGKVWQFGWHQLRRTGAVNMNASGVVGESSAQYQLKHATSGMRRYYGQGYYHLNIRLNGEARNEYIKTMYEMIALEFNLLQGSRFTSPHGEKRKLQMLNIMTDKDHKTLLSAAKSGKIQYREILLGGCTNTSPCAFGGIDYIARCGGGDGRPACDLLLLDREKTPQIRKLGKVIKERLTYAPEGSPLQESLIAQLRAVENVLNAL